MGKCFLQFEIRRRRKRRMKWEWQWKKFRKWTTFYVTFTNWPCSQNGKFLSWIKIFTIYSLHRQCTMLYTIYIQVHEINALITIAICGMYVLWSLFIAIQCNALQFGSIALYSIQCMYIAVKANFQLHTTNNIIKRSKIIISGFKVCQMPD